jgi:hypothetical protein
MKADWHRTIRSSGQDSQSVQHFTFRSGRETGLIQGKKQAFHRLVGWDETFIETPLGRVVGCILVADHRIRLGTFLPLNDVELHIIALFQCLVSVQLN